MAALTTAASRHGGLGVLGGRRSRPLAAVAPAALVLVIGGVIVVLRAPPEMGALLTGAGALLVAAAVWALVDLERFVLVALLGAMIYPAAVLQPAGAQVAVGDVLVVVALAAWVVRRSLGAGPAPRVSGNPLVAPALLYAGVTAASLAWSTSVGDTAKATLQIAEIVVVIALLFASVPTSPERIRGGMLAYVVLTCLLALLAVALFVPRAASGDVSGQYLPGLHKNATGSFLAIGLVLAYGLWLVERRPRVRRGLALASAVECAGLFATVSRGAVAGAVVAVMLASLLLSRRRLLTAALAAGLAAVFAVALSAPLTARTLAAGGYPTSVVRELSFENAVAKIGERPALGSGAGTYWDYIPQLGIGLADPNNVFLLTWAELGIAGIAALMFLLWRFARALARAGRLDRAARAPAVVAGAAAVSLLVHFQVDSTWTRGSASLCFAFMGLLVAALRLAPAAAQPRARPQPHPRADRLPVPVGPEVPVDRAPWAAGPAPGLRRHPEPARPPLRVLHVVTSDAFAGIERHVVRLTRELRARGCAAELACPPSAGRLRAAAVAAGVPVLPSADVRGRTWVGALVRLLAPDPPDVVHLHDGRAAAAGPMLARLGEPLLVRTQHFVRPASSERAGWRGDASLSLHRALNRELDGFIAVSDSVAQAARGRREIGSVDVAVICPGIDVPGPEIVARAQALRRQAADPTVAFVGRLEAEKRLPLLLSAAARVLQTLPACRFVIAGRGGAEEELRRLADRVGIARALTWLGEVDEPATVLERAHVYVNPSAAEGFGLATAEAMALGLPVVAADTGASAEVVEDGVSGFLVTADDVASLAAAIVRLAGDPALAAEMGAAGRRRAAALYGAGRTADETLALYRRLQARARP